ncbi:unnamed protein product [Effrenium voratum]|uniref:Amino acid transporter transmembrane domain-containing protein n=1 Tax=Effrenium voratum TaxID=2562239 RepID=A0AA36MSV7_9DINO|nr:unnamed protein product [Effrenium voratum]
MALHGSSPQVLGAVHADAATASSTPPSSPARSDVDDVDWDLDFAGLWEGGWEELLREDAEQIGEAYQASILGGVLGADDEHEIEEEMGEGFKESSGHREGRREHKLSAKGLISNFVLSIVGSTVLGLASQMPRLGWILPPISVVAGCIIVSENTRLVTATIDKLQAQKGITVLAYPDFVRGALGIWGKRISSATSMLALLGMMCTTLVLEAQNFNFLLPVHWSWFGCNACGHKWWAVFLTPIGLAYVFGNPGILMKRAAFLGPIVCILTIILAWMGVGMSVAASTAMPEVCRGSHKLLPAPSEFFSVAMVLELAKVGSYGFYNFAVIVTVPTLRNQMKNPKKTAPAAIFAYILALCLFLPIMFLGYLGFGNEVPENLVDGMRDDRPSGWWALNRSWETGKLTVAGACLDLIVTINLLMTEAIYIPCTVLAIEASFPGLFRRGPAWASKVMRGVVVALRLLVAVGIESFVAMSALVAALFCVCNNIIFPIVAFHYFKVKKVSRLRKICHALVLVSLGCGRHDVNDSGLPHHPCSGVACCTATTLPKPQ